MQILVVSNRHTAAGPQETERICAALRRHGAAVIEREFKTSAGSQAMPDIPSGTDLIVAIGGDGTIMHVAKRAAAQALPVLGINSGKLGFLAGLEVNEIDGLQALFTGEYETEERLLLDIAVEGTPDRHLAMNEAVVSRGALSRLVDLTVVSGEQDVMRYRADGVMIATPTGSTAYSLSAGGPVVDPKVPALLLTPICPHSLYARSYVFAADTELTVRPAAPDGNTFLTVDGEQEISLLPGQAVMVRRAAMTAKLIRLKQQSFYDVLHHKLINRDGGRA